MLGFTQKNRGITQTGHFQNQFCTIWSISWFLLFLSKIFSDVIFKFYDEFWYFFNEKYKLYCFFATYWSCSLHAILFTDKCVLIYFKNDKYQYQIHVYQWKSDLIQSTRMDLISLFGFTNTSKVEWNAHYQIMKKVGILTDNQMLRWALDNVCKSRGMSTLLNDFFHFSIPSWSEIQKLAHQITIANCANRSMLSVLPVLLFCFPKNWFDEI